VSAYGRAGQRHFFFPPFLFSNGAKNFAVSEPPPNGGASDAEASAAIPFPFKPLFLAAAADADSVKVLLLIFRNF
jgi:hypothetical protein